jgi:sulfoxide reductase catalytic subunit YedY
VSCCAFIFLVYSCDELKEVAGSTVESPTRLQDITSYNNFYEFGTSKQDPALYAHKLPVRPWTVTLEGLVHKPRTLDIERILKLAPLEERIYRLRCVEAWSMVVPWVGFPLSALLRQVEPLGSAKYVEFESFHDAKLMSSPIFNPLVFPYIEGLRLDEAMHPLTLLAVGLYGEVLPKQNGAPLRLAVPWKYGFKSAKSIVRIRFTDEQPLTSWNRSAPHDFGFYSNVNPQVSRERYDQRRERRLGEFLKRDTLMFNGYADEVSGLYAGMDLARAF